MSPYGFKTAQEHYEALLAETRRAAARPSTPTTIPGASGPASTSAHGRRAEQPEQLVLGQAQPDLDDPVAADAGVSAADGAGGLPRSARQRAQWPSTFCWPEGFMRRWYPAAVWEHYIIVTPDIVQISTGVARNFIQDIHVGREFNMEDVANGGVPRLGAEVPRWYGETIGFWDGDTLITWTSNIQGWKSHAQFEFSNKMQSIEIYTPIREDGTFVGLNHETILYDADALVEPVRIVRNLHKINEFTDADADALRVHRVRADDLLGRRPTPPLTPGSHDRVRDARHVRPSVGGDLGRALRARHESPTSEDLFNFERRLEGRAQLPARGRGMRRLKSAMRRSSCGGRDRVRIAAPGWPRPSRTSASRASAAAGRWPWMCARPNASARTRSAASGRTSPSVPASSARPAAARLRRRRAASGRRLHVHRLLQGSRPLDGPALLPLQQSHAIEDLGAAARR